MRPYLPPICLALSAMVLLSWAQCASGDTPRIAFAPDWGGVTWETRYDQAKLAHVLLVPAGGAQDQLPVVTKIEASFKPAQGVEMPLEGGGGSYVFDNWTQLVKLLEALVGGITISQTAFYPDSSHPQIFAISAAQQNELRGKSGTLTLKVACELYRLKLKAKIPLNAPITIKNGTELIQYAPTGDTARLAVSRTGTLDPTDKRPARVLVFLLVDPDNHTATLLQEVAPNGFFMPGRDPTKLNLVYQLGVVPGKTPLDHEILYLFDPVVGDTTQTTVSDPNFKMQWP